MIKKSMAEFFQWDSGIVARPEEIPDEAEYYTVLPEGFYYLRVNQHSTYWPMWLEPHSRWEGDRPIYVPPEEMAFWREITVAFDSGLDNFSSHIRRPGYQLRGRPVTPEQASEVIRRTQHRDLCPFPCVEDPVDDFLDCLHFDGSEWCHPDGQIGTVGITLKYPNAWELVDEWGQLLAAFPFLDLMILLWNVDEGTGVCKKQVLCGIRVCSGQIQLLAPSNAWKRFVQYEITGNLHSNRQNIL